jgi:EAL domain-containing protein (putative c-di-GMP-specific phosphodiesterase class I)/FixJ family two-component response regulator
MNAPHLHYLVVEDDELQRDALAIMLEELGAARVSRAEDGRSGLLALSTASPPVDIIVTDLNMPGMDGIEFIRHIATSGRRVSLVFASAVEPSLLSAMQAIVTAYGISLLGMLPKPVTAQALLQVLETYRKQPAASLPAERTCSEQEVLHGLLADEFAPYFQPKVALASGRIAGFEALARWRRKGEDVRAPNQFIPVMEKHGLVEELTWTIMRKAAQACHDWQESKLDFSVSVNLSVSSLTDVQFADRLMGLLKEVGLPASRLILEITESTAVTSHLGHVLDNLSRLRLRGVGLSIDDYGTGYSSLQQLGRIPFTELKIDQSFVRGAAAIPSHMAILRSSIEIAKALKLVCVAEGVETADQWRLLRSSGCDLAQGYLISRPMAAEDIVSWSRRWHQNFASLVPSAVGAERGAVAR